MDALEKLGAEFSPYNYSFYNPIYFIDFDSNWPTPHLVKGGKLVSSFKLRVHPWIRNFRKGNIK